MTLGLSPSRSLALSVVVGSALALFTAPSSADSMTIKVGVNKSMTAQLMTPDDLARHPAILVLHTSRGLQSEDMAFAKRLVGEGYVVLVPYFLDAYGIRAKTRQETFTTFAQSIYADFIASLGQLRDNEHVDGKRLGAIGFSNGGYFALWLAATGQVQAGVSYYGAITGAGTDRSLGRFRETFSKTSAPVLVLHGASDSTVPVAKAIELDSILTTAQANHEFYQYPNAGHGFDRTGGADNEAAAEDSWQKTKAFLSKALRQ